MGLGRPGSRPSAFARTGSKSTNHDSKIARPIPSSVSFIRRFKLDLVVQRAEDMGDGALFGERRKGKPQSVKCRQVDVILNASRSFMLDLLFKVSEGVLDEVEVTLCLVSDEANHGIRKASWETKDRGFSDVRGDRYAHCSFGPHATLRQSSLAICLLVGRQPPTLSS
jgi:hypothetical protein